jgi:hypothetical protein
LGETPAFHIEVFGGTTVWVDGAKGLRFFAFMTAIRMRKEERGDTTNLANFTNGRLEEPRKVTDEEEGIGDW